jgi:transcription elongation factor Elf1
MNFTCPYCGNNSFIITTEDHSATSHATCGKCAKVIPFDKNMMTNAPAPKAAQTPPPARSDRVH